MRAGAGARSCVRAPRLVLALLVFALLLGGAQAGAPSLRLVMDGESIRPATPLEGWTGKRLSLADVDADGDLDVLAQNGNGRVYALDARSGRALVEVAPSYPYGPDLGPFNGPKAGDLDGDGLVELVNVNRAAVVSVWTLAPGDGGLDARLRWERHLADHHPRPSADAGPVLADLDGDGLLEIIVQTEERGAYALHHDGTPLWSLAEYGGNAEAVVTDVDADGDLDAVFFTDGGVAYAVDGPTGEVLWRFEARRHGVWPGSAPSPGVVADLDGDGRVEGAFCARNVENATEAQAPGGPRYRQHHFVLLAFRNATLLWKAKPAWGNPMCSAHLMAADADGDGRKELFGMDWNTIGHKPGNWERTGSAHAFSFDASGRERWHVALDAFSAKPPVALADADGDGRDEVVAYDAYGLVLLDPRTGERVGRVPLGEWEVMQGPLVADLDADGRRELVVAVSGRSDAILVFGLDPSKGEPAWPGWEPPVPSPRPRPTPAPPAAEAPAPATPSAPEPVAPPTPFSEPTPPTAAPAPDLPQAAPRAIPQASVLLGLALAALLRPARRR